MIDSAWLAREALEKHSVNIRQFIDFRQSTLPNGMRHIEAHNSSGLTFSVLPDRGLDIWEATFNGLPLTWLSQGSPHLPDYGVKWLRLFNGGLLTTCGLTHAGPPETDPDTGEQRDLHGLYTRLPATDVAVSGAWDGDRYVLELTGKVAEAQLFSEQLELTRTYRLVLGDPTIAITDHVVNKGDLPAPLMVLYHINLGYPLVRAGTRFHSPFAAVYPRDDWARPGFDRWPDYDAASPRYNEQVFFHHLKADGTGKTVVALLQESFGLQIGWDTSTLPYLTQWKNTREGIYVSGIEPGNCIPEGRSGARAAGRLVTLEPGQDQHFRVAMSVLDGAEAVLRAHERVAALQQRGNPVAGCQLDDYATK